MRRERGGADERVGVCSLKMLTKQKKHGIPFGHDQDAMVLVPTHGLTNVPWWICTTLTPSALALSRLPLQLAATIPPGPYVSSWKQGR